MSSTKIVELARLEEKLNQSVMINGEILRKLEVIEMNTPRRVSTIDGKAALSVARTAAVLSVSARTVRNLIASGRLKAAIVDRIYLVPAVEIERFLGIDAPEAQS